MPPDTGRTFLRALEVFRPAFTAPTFARWLLLMAAWVLCTERHAITECLVVGGVATTFEHSAFHRVFGRRRWELDALGRLLLLAVLPRLTAAGVRLQVALDDTLAPHKGPHVFGLGCHVDAVRSTRKTKVFAFGHVWVTLALVVTVPFAVRPWALPLLFRLYRPQRACAADGTPFRKKTELARELVDVLGTWLPDTAFDLLVDSGYANRTVLRDLPARVRVIAAVTAKAALRTAGGRVLARGRHSPRGAPLPSLATHAAAPDTAWQTVTAWVYGGARTMPVTVLDAQWYDVLGAATVRFVVVRCTTGTLPLRVFLCTDATLAPVALLEAYARRWALEQFYFDAKQFLGFAAGRVRLEAAVRRLAPCVGLLYGALTLWFWTQSARGLAAVIPARPWYGHKAHVSFEDILRTARHALAAVDLRAEVEAVAPLRRLRFRRAPTPTTRLPTAA